MKKFKCAADMTAEMCMWGCCMCTVVYAFLSDMFSGLNVGGNVA